MIGYVLIKTAIFKIHIPQIVSNFLEEVKKKIAVFIVSGLIRIELPMR